MNAATDVRADDRGRDRGRVLVGVVGGLAVLGAVFGFVGTLGGEAPAPCPDARVRGAEVLCGALSANGADEVHERHEGYEAYEAGSSAHADARAWLLGEKLDLNRASALDLARIPGIGKNLARAIVAERERLGGFRTLSQVDAVRGVGPAKLRLLERYVEVPSASPGEP